MNIHTPKIGVVETIGVLGAAVGLAELLRQLVFHLGDARNSNRKTIVGMLADQLDSIIQESKISNCPTSPANVDARLKQLTVTAQELVDSVSSGTLGRLKDVIVHGKFDKRIEELRTGITDIGNTLRLLAMVTVACPFHHNMNAAQASVVMQGQNSVQAAPLGYPLGVVQGQIPFPAVPLAYPPTVYSPAASPSAFYPPFGSPAYGYAYGYPPKYGSERDIQ